MKKDFVTHSEIKKIVKETAKEAVSETFTSLGFDVAEPHETQADQHYLRKLRKGSEFMSLRIKVSLIAFIIPAFLYMAWEVVKEAFHK